MKVSAILSVYSSATSCNRRWKYFRTFWFSDVLTVFLAMDAQVELYHAGMVSLKEFIDMPYDNDILVALHVAKSRSALPI